VKILAVAVAVVAGGWFWQHQRHGALEGRLSRVATDLAGRRVHVRCQGFFSALVDVNWREGEVQFPDGHPADDAFLTRGTCLTLDHFRGAHSRRRLDCLLADGGAVGWGSDCGRRVRQTAEAITVLTHESMHLRGWASEAQAQCYAIQQDPWTVVRLGGTPAEGAAVARFVLGLQPFMPSEYQSGECRAGGRLDLHPDTPAFPAEEHPEPIAPNVHGPALL
jgi:hypothetical protein